MMGRSHRPEPGSTPGREVFLEFNCYIYNN